MLKSINEFSPEWPNFGQESDNLEAIVSELALKNKQCNINSWDGSKNRFPDQQHANILKLLICRSNTYLEIKDTKCETVNLIFLKNK